MASPFIICHMSMMSKWRCIKKFRHQQMSTQVAKTTVGDGTLF